MLEVGFQPYYKVFETTAATALHFVIPAHARPQYGGHTAIPWRAKGQHQRHRRDVEEAWLDGNLWHAIIGASNIHHHEPATDAGTIHRTT